MSTGYGVSTFDLLKYVILKINFEVTPWLTRTLTNGGGKRGEQPREFRESVGLSTSRAGDPLRALARETREIECGIRQNPLYPAIYFPYIAAYRVFLFEEDHPRRIQDQEANTSRPTAPTIRRERTNLKFTTREAACGASAWASVLGARLSLSCDTHCASPPPQSRRAFPSRSRRPRWRLHAART